MAVTDFSVLYAENWSPTLSEEQKAAARAAIGAADVAVAGNPFTSAEKTKLSSIQAGAEVNVQADWTQANSDDDSFIQHKPSIILLTPDEYMTLSEPAGGGVLNIGLAISTGSYEVDGSSSNA